MRKFLLPVALALLTPLAAAQSQPAGRGKAAPAAATPQGPQGVELATDPFRLESVGLSIRLPAIALAQRNSVGDQQTVQVVPGGPNPEWMFNIQTPQSRNTAATAETVAEDVLEQIRKSVGVIDRKVDGKGKVTEKVVSSKAVVLQPVKELKLAPESAQAARPGANFYVKLPGEGKQPAVVRGYTVFRVEPGRFVTFDLTTTEPAYQRARLAYETSIATARFSDPGTMAAARGAAVEAGVALLGRLTPADYDRATEHLKDQYYRLTRAKAGDTSAAAEEVAYRRVRAWKGRRGEIDASRSPAKFKAVEMQEGYLVRIDARYLSEGRVIDSVGIFFMSPDRKEEAWSLQTAVREAGGGTGKKPRTATETGARSGLTMSVAIAGDARDEKAVQPLVPKQGYLNQLECFILPQLLIGAHAQGELGFYSYQSETANIHLRRDEVVETGDPAGPWRITTKVRDDVDPQASLYGEHGELVQTVVPEPTGALRTWTPVTLPKLAEIWRAKGLPMN